MKQTLADLAIRLGLPQVVRVEKGGEGVREEVIQPTTVVYSGSNLPRTAARCAGNDAFLCVFTSKSTICRGFLQEFNSGRN